MRWLTFRRRLSRTSRRDSGAVAVVFAVLLAMGVVTGMLALTVDVGGIMVERRQLQNGADATSMALAQNCAENTPMCADTAPVRTDLANLAGLNAKSGLNEFSDGLAQLNSRPDANAQNGICGRGTSLPLCTSASAAAPVGNLGNCPPLPSWVTSQSLPYVETYVLTKSTQANNTILPKFFSQALAGGSGPNTSVSACARATWGPAEPSSATVLALTMSECDWRSQTGYTGPGTATYPPGPVGVPGYDNDSSTPAPPWPTASERVIFSKGNDTTCATSAPGGTAPGGFAWLDSISATNCLGTVVNNGWIHGDTGADGCEQADLTAFLGKIVYIPVFDCMMKTMGPIVNPPGCNSGTGNLTYYHVAGYAGFYLSGWQVTKGSQASIATGRTDCGGSGGAGGQRCLFGWFLKDLVPEGDIVIPSPGDPNYGLTVVKPAG